MHKINNPNTNILLQKVTQKNTNILLQKDNSSNTSNNTYTKTRINPNDRQTYTYSDSLQSMDKIQEQLKGYERVDDIELVEIGTPVRYITWKYGKMRFCVGGLLVAKMPTYCKLTNYKKDIQWNVKKEHQKNPNDKKDIFKTIFYKRCFNTHKDEEEGGNEEDNEIDLIMQSKDINKFYKRLNKKDKREKWLQNNIYRKKY